MQYSSSTILEVVLLLDTVSSFCQTINMQSGRQSRRHHQKRHLIEEIESKSCARRATANAHESFSRMFNRRDNEMYTFLKPQQQIFNVFQPVHGHELSVRPRQCVEESEEVKEFELVHEHPVGRRAMCIFNYVLNYNAQRLPASIPEVKCSCRQVIVNNERYECEQVYYDMRVLLFDENCGTYVEGVEKIALGCVSVLPVQRTRGDKITFHKEKDAGTPT